MRFWSPPLQDAGRRWPIKTRAVFAVLAAALAILAGGCGKPLPKITIAINAGVEGDALRSAAVEWGDKSGTEIEVVELPYSNLFEKLLLDLTSKTGAYDVIMMDDPWFPRMAEGGKLVELPQPDSDFLESTLNVCREPYKTGKFYALPYVGNSQLFFYRKDLFEREHLPEPATWDDVLADASKLGFRTVLNAPSTERFGYVMRAAPGNASVTDFMPLFWAYGAEMFDAAGNPTVNSKEGVAALEMMLKLGQFSPPGYAGFNADEVSAHLLQSTAAMSINWPAWIPAMDDPKKSKVVSQIGFAQMPGERKPGQAELGAWLLAVPVASRNVERAKQFINWATSKQPMKEAAVRGNPPTRRQVFTDPNLIERLRAFPAQLKSLETARPRPRTPQWNEIENAFGIAISKANAGSLSATAAMNQAQSDIAAIVSRAVK
jgi:multiple sugar transport system substrate-binding protein